MKIFQRETYNEVLEVLIEDNMELTEKTKKEIEEKRKSNNFVSIKEAKKS